MTPPASNHQPPAVAPHGPQTAPEADLPLWAVPSPEKVTTATQAKARAIQTAEDHAAKRWRENAWKALRLCADIMATFCSEDVWDAMQKAGADPLESDRNPSALGPIFLRAARADLIRKTGRTRPSTRDVCHRDLTEWESTIKALRRMEGAA